MKVEIIIDDVKNIGELYRNNYFGIIVTSPPYYLTLAQDIYEPPVAYGDYDEYLEDMKNIFDELYTVMRPGRICAVNISEVIYRSKSYPVPYDFWNLMREVGFTYQDTIIWEKPSGISAGFGRRAGNVLKYKKPLYYRPNRIIEWILIFSKGKIRLKETNDTVKINREYLGNVWHINPVRPQKRLHPLQYPVELPYWLLNFYAYRDEPVLDPFMGAGTTLYAAQKLGFRHIVGYDIDPEVLPSVYKLLNIPGDPPKEPGKYEYRVLGGEYIVWWR